MAKLIKLTDEDIEKAVEEFRETIVNSKAANGKISYTKDIGSVDAKAELFFSEMAYIKMKLLVDEWDKEIAWHGTAVRYGNDENNAYLIEDIMVYPQEVTGTTVTTDQDEYQNWLYDFDDETFNKIRMQGHSHVNMATSPSSTDLDNQAKILDQLTDDMFYIFLIWNKKNGRTIKIYDMKKNILFETEDISLAYMSDGSNMIDFVNEAKNVVKEKTWSTSSYTKPATVTTTNASTSKDEVKKSSYPYEWDDDDDYWSSYYGSYYSSNKSSYAGSGYWSKKGGK